MVQQNGLPAHPLLIYVLYQGKLAKPVSCCFTMFVDSFILGYRYDYYKNERDQQKSSLSRSVRFCRFFHSHLFVFTLLIWAKGIKRASTIVLTIISTNHIFLKLELHPVCSDRKANAEIPKRRTNMAYKLKATRYGGEKTSSLSIP